MRKNTQKHRLYYSTSGFTLPEVLVSVLILGFLAAAINAAMLASNNSWAINSAEVELQQDLRQAMLWIKQDLQHSGHAYLTASIPVNPERDEVTYPDPGTGDPALAWSTYTTFNLRVVDGINGRAPDWDTEVITYYRESNTSDSDYNTLLRTKGTSPRYIAENISSIQARRLYANSDVVEFAIQGQKNTSGGGAQGRDITLNLNFKVHMRN